MRNRRLSLRALMLAVLVASLAIWSCVMWRRSTHFSKEATKHSISLGIAKNNLLAVEFDWHTGFRERYEHLSPLQEKNRIFYQGEIRREEQLYRRYRRAAMFPWTSLEEEPPLEVSLTPGRRTASSSP